MWAENVGEQDLLVEGDKAIADFISINLRYTEYKFSIIVNGGDAVDLLERDHSFDLTLLDIMLPGKDGLSLKGCPWYMSREKPKGYRVHGRMQHEGELTQTSRI